MIDRDHNRKVVSASAIAGWGSLLLVEDEPTVVKVTKAMLEKLGYDVLTAANGVEAIDIFKAYAHLIRLVISDLDIPQSNGWEVLAAVRRKQPEMPVVLTSGYNEISGLPPWGDERPPVFLEKPYGLPALRSALETALVQSFALSFETCRSHLNCTSR